MSRVAILIAIAAAVIAALTADKRGRNWSTWMAVCLFFPPALIVLLALPPVYSPGLNRRCPNCGAVNSLNDPSCRRCGSTLPIEMVECPSCKSFVQQGRYCSECGSPLK